jgi:hypothetical protein
MRTLRNVGAAAPGSVTPTSDEAGSARNAPAPEKQDQQTEAYFAVDDASRKAVATMRARAALAGCTLHELADGGYLVCRWNLSTFAPCLRCVGDLLRQIGGSHG